MMLYRFWIHFLDSSEYVGELNMHRNHKSGRLTTAWFEIDAHSRAGIYLDEDYFS
jgi:hypothetical protein